MRRRAKSGQRPNPFTVEASPDFAALVVEPGPLEPAFPDGFEARHVGFVLGAHSQERSGIVPPAQLGTRTASGAHDEHTARAKDVRMLRADESTGRANVVVLTEVAPSSTGQDGLAARLDSFVRGLAERASIVVVHAVPDAPGRAPAVEWVDPSLILLHTPRRRLRGRVSMLARFPGSSFDRAHGTLRELLSQLDPDTVVLYLPQVASADGALPARTKPVFVLEEEWSMNATAALDLSRFRARVGASVRQSQFRRLYQHVGRRSGAVVAISDFDAALFSRFMPPGRIRVIARGITPNGEVGDVPHPQVDVGLFGDFRLRRNFEPALRFFLHAERSGVPLRFGFFGACGEELRPLRERGAVVSGMVNDLRACYGLARVVVIPEHRGAGVKTTALEAWAAARPLVLHEGATRGLQVRPGENCLVGASTSELFELCVRVLGDSGLADSLGKAGRRTVIREHDVAQSVERFVSLCLLDQESREFST